MNDTLTEMFNRFQYDFDTCIAIISIHTTLLQEFDLIKTPYMQIEKREYYSIVHVIIYISC